MQQTKKLNIQQQMQTLQQLMQTDLLKLLEKVEHISMQNLLTDRQIQFMYM